MDEIGEFLAIMFAAGLGVLLFLFSIMATVNAINYYYVSANQIVITDSGAVIYEGRAACVDVKSGGSTTTVTIMNPAFLCSLTVKANYTSRDIVVKPL